MFTRAKVYNETEEIEGYAWNVDTEEIEFGDIETGLTENMLKSF